MRMHAVAGKETRESLGRYLRERNPPGQHCDRCREVIGAVAYYRMSSDEVICPGCDSREKDQAAALERAAEAERQQMRERTHKKPRR
jgi:hypothetical protein